MAFSTLWFALTAVGPFLVSSAVSNLISPTTRVGCTAVHSLARLF